MWRPTEPRGQQRETRADYGQARGLIQCDCIRKAPFGQRRWVRMLAVIRVEFHCHTSMSKDCLVPPGHLVQCAVRKGIDRLVITDHNTISGAVAAREQDPAHVIVGEEIMTTQGELLAAFVRSEIPPGLTPVETISRFRDQGAFISVSHPFDVHRKGAGASGTFWKSCHWWMPSRSTIPGASSPGTTSMAQEFAERHDLAGTVGSDAHTCWELGRSTQILPDFWTADDLRRVIRAGAVLNPLVPALDSPDISLCCLAQAASGVYLTRLLPHDNLAPASRGRPRLEAFKRGRAITSMQEYWQMSERFIGTVKWFNADQGLRFHRPRRRARMCSSTSRRFKWKAIASWSPNRRSSSRLKRDPRACRLPMWSWCSNGLSDKNGEQGCSAQPCSCSSP